MRSAVSARPQSVDPTPRLAIAFAGIRLATGLGPGRTVQSHSYARWLRDNRRRCLQAQTPVRLEARAQGLERIGRDTLRSVRNECAPAQAGIRGPDGLREPRSIQTPHLQRGG